MNPPPAWMWAVAARVMPELTDLCAKAGSALLLIRPRPGEAGHWCEQIAVLESGAPGRAGPLAAPAPNRARDAPGGGRGPAAGGRGFLNDTSRCCLSSMALALLAFRCPHRPGSVAGSRPSMGSAAAMHEGENRRGVGARLWQRHLFAGPWPAWCRCRRLRWAGTARYLRALRWRSSGGRRQIRWCFFFFFFLFFQEESDPLACLNPAMAWAEAVAYFVD